MTTGIIYQAYNKISGKSYIGQTIQSLHKRKIQHYSDTTKQKYKFSNALNKYNKDDWDWVVLIEVELDELDKYEIFFIDKFDTLKNGYNTIAGGKLNTLEDTNHPFYSGKIYEVWHPTYKFLSLTRKELIKIDKCFSHSFYRLISGKSKQINGFVLAENRDKYDKIMNVNIYKFYHEEFGEEVCSAPELAKKYNLTYKSITQITTGFCKKIHGWIVLEVINQKPNKRKKYDKYFNDLNDYHNEIKKKLEGQLEKDKYYTTKEINIILKHIYKELRINKTGKSTDIHLFLNATKLSKRINKKKTFGYIIH